MPLTFRPRLLVARSMGRLGRERGEREEGGVRASACCWAGPRARAREKQNRAARNWRAELGHARKQGEQGGPRTGEGRLGQQAEKRRGKRKILSLFLF